MQWQPFDSMSNWVIGAHGGGGSFDSTGFYSAGIGVLYHFAAPKSLKRQLREDRLYRERPFEKESKTNKPEFTLLTKTIRSPFPNFSSLPKVVGIPVVFR